MNIRDLTYVQAVAKLKHFGRAAEACHVSQPALSSQIKKLEDELGVVLFERNNRSVSITEVGQRICDLADDALEIVETIRMTAQSTRDPLAGRFQLGFIPTIAPYLIPHFVGQSRHALPQLTLQLQEDITERLTQSLIDGDIDAAILATPPESAKLDAIRLYDEPFWVIFPSSHALHLINAISTDDLPIDELLLLSEGHCFRDQALDICQLDTAVDTRNIRATSLATLVNMVAAGQGITLVPAMALSGWADTPGVSTKKLKDPSAYRRIYLTFRKSFPRKNLLEKMADLICDNLPDTVRAIHKSPHTAP